MTPTLYKSIVKTQLNKQCVTLIMEQTKSSHHYPIFSDSSDSSNCTSSKFTKDAQI